MRLCSIVIGLLASLILFGCGGAKREAAAPETNPWADYKGTYANGPEPASVAEKPTTTTTSADAKPADAKPARGGKPKAAAAAAAPPTDAKAMYSGDAKTDEAAAATPVKKGGKKRGNKAGAKKPAPAGVKS